MKKLLFLIMTLLLSTAFLFAQQGTSNPDQGSNQGATASQGTNPNQGGTAGQNQPGRTGQAGGAQTQGQAGAQAGGQAQGQAGGRLPQTATPLPLLVALGLGSLGTGLAARRKRS